LKLLPLLLTDRSRNKVHTVALLDLRIAALGVPVGVYELTQFVFIRCSQSGANL
jgi:hypothetical protein